MRRNSLRFLAIQAAVVVGTVVLWIVFMQRDGSGAGALPPPVITGSPNSFRRVHLCCPLPSAPRVPCR